MTTTRPRIASRTKRREPRFAAIDFETADNGSDSACAVGVVLVKGTRIVDRHYSLLKPPRRLFRYTGIHGITWKDVADAPTFREYWPTLLDVIRDVDFLAAHNAPFDKGVLHACCESARLPIPQLPFTCTMKLARATWNLYPTRLPHVCEHLGIELDHHHALSDALACAQIVIEAQRVGAL